MSENRKKIAFIHPDLGIGGAERLVVDAAIGLQELGNEVMAYTSHCDKTHCFEEVSSGELAVEVFGDFLPTNLLGKFSILFAILRQLWLTVVLVVTGKIRNYDYFIVDQLSFCVPLLRLFADRKSRVIFYCHFPDQLLAQEGGTLKKLYRLPFDTVEELTTGASDTVIVNSSFTKGVFKTTFQQLNKLEPNVIHPCVDVSLNGVQTISKEDQVSLEKLLGGSPYFLSINRFERKKNIELAIKSYDAFAKMSKVSTRPKLIVAGGYDTQVRENVDYLEELYSICDDLKLKHATVKGNQVTGGDADVIFMLSIKTSFKNHIIKEAELLLYTPSFEHFGIVPIESMLLGTPVLACNNGGPLESIVKYDGSNLEKATGFTIDPEVNQWAQVLLEYFDHFDIENRARMSKNGVERVKKFFSRKTMSEKFLQTLTESDNARQNRSLLINLLIDTRIQILGIAIPLAMYVILSRV